MKSYATSVLLGVPQGTVLASLLFLMYTNDLPTCVQNKVRLYADDALIYSCNNSKNDCISLQQGGIVKIENLLPLPREFTDDDSDNRKLVTFTTRIH